MAREGWSGTAGYVRRCGYVAGGGAWLYDGLRKWGILIDGLVCFRSCGSLEFLCLIFSGVRVCSCCECIRFSIG